MTKSKNFFDIGKEMNTYWYKKNDLLDKMALDIVIHNNMTKLDILEVISLYDLNSDTSELVLKMFEVVDWMDNDNET